MTSTRMQRILTVVAAASSLAVVSPALGQGLPQSGTISFDPAAEQKMLQNVKLADGFKATLFAGPPYAMYPTCLTDSPDGALFVCVDPNLSLSQEKGRGRIMRLVDTNGDGHADRYTVFAEIDSPRGVVSDGKTLYVMHPPFLTALRDTNGDGVADERQELVSGLGFDLDFRGADHTTNGIAMGIDGWIYVAVGDYGFRRAVGRDGIQISHRGGSVVRVRPDGTGLEIYATGTRNIYDVAIDPFLHLYSRDNTNDGDGWNTRLHYIAQNANLGYPTLYKNFASEHFPSLHDYGAGSGTGGVWVQDPGFPDGYNNTLYTADWTVNKVFRHPLTPKGASFDVQQEEVATVIHPADLVMDGNSNLYVASLSGGTFTYAGDTVGYVIRVSYPGKAASKAPQYGKLNDAQLVDVVLSANAEHRLQAQRELLRRGAKPATVSRLEQAIANSQQPAYARVAAMFTLKQLVGTQANAALQRAAADADPQVRALALRALVDNKEQLTGVPAALYTRALSDADARVQAQAVNGLARLGARDQADAILPLTASADPALAHLAVHALVSLGASEAALKAVDGGSPAVRAGALSALQQMHDVPTVAALVSRYERAQNPALRREILLALARLYNEEGTWLGDWWTTRPSFIGPYFDPKAWQGSPRIEPVLEQALLTTSGDDFSSLVDALVLNRVLPQGAKPLLAALTTSRDPQREEVVRALVGRSQLDGSAAPLLAKLDAKSPELHAAVAQLVVAETNLDTQVLPLVQRAALDAKLDADVRSKALASLARMEGPEALAAASSVFAQLNPTEDSDPAVATAWRRFVGDRRNFGSVDYFAKLANTGSPAQRVLAYSVLVQVARANRVPEEAKTAATSAIAQAWENPATSQAVVQAISVMRAESAYTSQLEQYKAKNGQK